MMTRRHKINFGYVAPGPLAFRLVSKAMFSDTLTEGPLVAEFERRFAETFGGWKHAITTSSGTTAGEVVWSAIRQYEGIDPNSIGAEVLTPACAFVATASCLQAAGCVPRFVDVELRTLNMPPDPPVRMTTMGIQLVMTMGNPSPIETEFPYDATWLVVDACEAHGSKVNGKPWNEYADAAIYSLYPAHMVCGVEGGVICTNNDILADTCRSIKSHGRPTGGYFDFQRLGFNAKWSEMHAAVGLDSIAGFARRYAHRRQVREKLLCALDKYRDDIILYPDPEGAEIAPHAFPLVLRDEKKDVRPLYDLLDREKGIECKTLFGSLPTQHAAFSHMRHKPGDFPVAERLGRTGLHFGCHELITRQDVAYIADAVGEGLKLC